MKYVKPSLIIFIALSLIASCSTVPSVKPGEPQALSAMIAEIEKDPVVAKNESAFKFLSQGIEHLKANELQEASKAFNITLSYDPQNSYYQFLNGLAYHLIAETSDPSKIGPAKIAYELALQFDANNGLASAQLGYIFLKERAYLKAQNSFSHALLLDGNNVDLLYGLAKSSYLVGDLDVAKNTISRAKYLDDDGSQDILSAYGIIMAANGDIDDAQASLSELEALGANRGRVDKLDLRIKDWERIYANPAGLLDTGMANKTQGNSNKSSVADEEEELSEPVKMVMVDIVLIRTEEFDGTNKGFNLLEGLSVQFSGEKTYGSDGSNENRVGSRGENRTGSREENRTENRTGSPTDTFGSNFRDSFSESSRENSADRRGSSSKIYRRTIGIPEITYNMNIFNASDDRNEILARPTLIALDGKESTFFSGSVLDIAVSGLESGQVKNINAGVELSVTPDFQDDGSIMFDIKASRSFFEIGAAGTFNESIRTSRNEVSANVIMEFEQTLILSGLREKQTSESKSGVPFLRDIPILQYFFSNEKTQDFHKSVIILMTPHRVTDENNKPEKYTGSPHLIKFKKLYGDDLVITENIAHVLNHLKTHKSYKELRQTDIFDKNWWGDTEKLDKVLRRSLSFLYY